MTSSGADEVHSRSAALGLLALVSVVWGVHWVVVKIGLGYLPPMTYGALRIAIGLGTVVALLAARDGSGGRRAPICRSSPRWACSRSRAGC